MVSLFFTIKCNKLYDCTLAKVTTLQEVRIKASGSTLHITVTGDVREAALEAPMVLQESRTKTESFLMACIATS